MPNKRTTGKAHAAQGMVEFAITVTFILLLIFGIIEFGHFLFVYSTVFSGAREAARYGAASGVNPNGQLYYQDCIEIRDSAIRVAVLAGLQESDIDIEYDNGPGITDQIPADCPVGGIGPVVHNGDRIVVSVTALYQPIVPLVNFPPLTINSTVARTIITDVAIR